MDELLLSYQKMYFSEDIKNTYDRETYVEK